jgi:hypothetical protein
MTEYEFLIQLRKLFHYTELGNQLAEDSTIDILYYTAYTAYISVTETEPHDRIIMIDPQP